MRMTDELERDNEEVEEPGDEAGASDSDSLKGNQTDKPSGRGGARPGAGRPPGVPDQKTKERRIAEAEFRDRVIRSKEHLMNAQMNLALGVQLLYVIRTVMEGKKQVRQRPELVTDQPTIEAYLAGELENDDEEYYFITTERPDNRALDSLFDRALGKAKQPIELDGQLNNRNLNSDIPADPDELEAVRLAILASVPPDEGGA